MTPDDHAQDAAPTGLSRAFPWAVLAAWLALALFGALRHEPWFDEAQSWLLARDSSPQALLLERLRYEGHPPLWHLLLMPFAKLGMPYVGLPVLSVLLAGTGVTALVFHPRIPAVWKAAVPFTYFIAFQYAVVARSYVLIFPLLMGILWIWPDRVRRLRTFTALLAALSLVSLHGLSLAGALLLHAFWDPDLRDGWKALPRSRWIELFATLALTLAVLVLVLYPPPDLAFQGRVTYLPGPGRMLQRGGSAALLGLAGDTELGGAAVALAGVWLFQRRKLALALALQFALFPITAIYANRWHEGIFVLALLLPLLLAAQEAPSQRENRTLRLVGLAGLALIAWHQLAGTARAYAWDLEEPYSGSREAARLLHGPVERGESIAAMGFPCIGLQPYFPRNIYSNYRLPGGGAYWSWGRPSPIYYALVRDIKPEELTAWARAQLDQAPAWVVVSHKFVSDGLYLELLDADPRYQKVLRARGKLVWKQEPDEPEQFVVYRRR